MDTDEKLDAERGQEAREEVLKLLKTFFEQLHITPPTKFPKIEIIPFESTESPSFGVDGFGQAVIRLRVNHVYGGWGPVEEIGHYLRHLLGPVATSRFAKNKEVKVQEFFAYIIRRFSQHCLPENLRLQFANYPLHPEADPNVNSLTVLRQIRHSNTKFRNLVRAGKSLMSLTAEDMDNMSGRREILEHVRSYRFAERIDLDKVDVRKLFALSDDDVITRFFTGEPDYRGLEKNI